MRGLSSMMIYRIKPFFMSSKVIRRFYGICLITLMLPSLIPVSGTALSAERQIMGIVEETESSVVIEDSRGNRVEIEKGPKRVLPLYTSFLKLWYECGGKAIGRPASDVARLTKGMRNLPVAGHVTSPDMERVLSFKPDLVLLHKGFPGHKRMIPVLNKSDITCLMLKYDGFEDYKVLVNIFCSLIGREDIRNDSLSEVEARMEKVIESVPDKGAPRVLILFGSTGEIRVKLPNSPVGKMVEDLKGRNIAGDAGGENREMYTFSMERVIQRNPEVILIQTMGDPQKIKERVQSKTFSNPAWNSVSAVKESRVHYLPLQGFLYKPNKGYPETYRYISKLLYPELRTEK